MIGPSASLRADAGRARRSRRPMRHPLHFTHAHADLSRTPGAARQSASPPSRRGDRPARPDTFGPARDRCQPACARADQGARVQRYPRRARRDAGTDLRQARRGAGAAHRQAAHSVASGAKRTGGRREAGTRDIGGRQARAERGSRQANRKSPGTGEGRQDDGKIRTAGATATEPDRESSCPATFCRRVESAWPARCAFCPGIA
jgi:hypothetical protein